MGLDLVVEACAKPGCEAEWRRTVERVFANDQPSDVELDRFAEISIPAHQRLGAPRVGYDPAADEWIIETRKAGDPEEIAAVLKDFHGYYALALVKSDGTPEYSHGGLYEGVDETSFRGAFLSDCGSILQKALIEQAWDHKFPEAALAYGHALMVAADAAGNHGPLTIPPPKRSFLSRLGLAKTAREPLPFDEQLKIVEAAGRWFIFWGERGHPIRAWY